MSKPPAFLIAHNPMAAPDEVYILHTRAPRFLAKVIDGTPGVVVELDSFNELPQHRLDGVLSRLYHWYQAYLKHISDGSK